MLNRWNIFLRRVPNPQQLHPNPSPILFNADQIVTGWTVFFCVFSHFIRLEKTVSSSYLLSPFEKDPEGNSSSGFRYCHFAVGDPVRRWSTKGNCVEKMTMFRVETRMVGNEWLLAGDRSCLRQCRRPDVIWNQEEHRFLGRFDFLEIFVNLSNRTWFTFTSERNSEFMPFDTSIQLVNKSERHTFTQPTLWSRTVAYLTVVPCDNK